MFTSTATQSLTDDLAHLADWEIRLILCARDVKLKSTLNKRPSTMLARFDNGVLFLDEAIPRGRIVAQE